MSKKVIIGALAGMMSLALIMPVYAAEGDPQELTTELTAAVPSKYTLSIPSKTTIKYGDKSTALNGYLKVTGNVEKDKSVSVTATKESLTLVGGSAEIPYELKQGNTVFSSASWDETELRAGSKQVSLTVNFANNAWDNALAGTYEGGIVFHAELSK